MTQRRIQDFGSPIVASSLKKMNSSYTKAARLSGFAFSVDGPDRLRINPGTAVTNRGVLIIEDEPKFLNIVNTSSPTDYTVYYDHTDQDVTGGVAAALTLAAGLLTPAVVSGVILGYVRYPGSSAPLATSHFVQPPELQIGRVTPTKEDAHWIVPVNSADYLVTGSSGGAIDITSVWDISGTKPEMYMKFRNNSLSTGTKTIVIPFKVGGGPYALLQLALATDINAALTPSIIDSAGNTEVLSAAFSGTPALTLHSVVLPRTLTQTPNTLIYLQLQTQMAVGREVKLQALGLNTYNLPV